MPAATESRGPFRLRLFGSIGLDDDTGAPVESVLRQPTRLLTLAVCLIDGQTGFVPRDRLLELFWPDAATDAARLCLRQALHYLKTHLGDAIESIPQLGVRIRDGWLASDVRDFDIALDGGRHADAVQVYHGPFLDAFHVNGGRISLERWIDETRSAYRRRAVDAAFIAAEQALAAGRYAAATVLLDKATRLNPDSEVVAERLIRTLERFGDTTAAIRAYESFAARFRHDVDLEPSPSLQSLANRLRDVVPQFTLAAEDSAEIRRLDELWFDAAGRGQWSQTLAIAAPDAMISPPNEPALRGLPAIRAWYESRPPAKRMDHALTSIRGTRDMAWTHGWFAVTVDDGAGGELTMRATYSSSYVRVSDGSWRVFHGSWNLVEPGPAI